MSFNIFSYKKNVNDDLEPIPKFDRNIALSLFSQIVICIQNEDNKRKNPTILMISDNLLDKIKSIFPKEKSSKTVGRPIVKYRKVLDGILYVLRKGCQWKRLPKEYGSGPTCHRRFQEWNRLEIFQNVWIRILKIYNDLIGVNWTWQSIDSISIKSPLGGR